MLGILYKIYQKKLEKEVMGKEIPRHVAVLIEGVDSTGLFQGLEKFIKWCKNVGIMEVTFAIDGFENVDEMVKFSEKVEGRVRLISDGKEMEFDMGGEFTVNLLVNFGGRREIIEAVRELAVLVKKGEIDPNEINESIVEKHLRITTEPDVIIRASIKSLDFLLWQSIYSEHVFFDIDWKNLRYIDFLRILREYQKRERRYGK